MNIDRVVSKLNPDYGGSTNICKYMQKIFTLGHDHSPKPLISMFVIQNAGSLSSEHFLLWAYLMRRGPNTYMVPIGPKTAKRKRAQHMSNPNYSMIYPMVYGCVHCPA